MENRLMESSRTMPLKILTKYQALRHNTKKWIPYQLFYRGKKLIKYKKSKLHQLRCHG